MKNCIYFNEEEFAILVDVGVADWECSDCNNCKIEDNIINYMKESYNEDFKGKIRDIFNVSKNIHSISRKINFQCSQHNKSLSVPCSITDCLYYVDNNFCMNCCLYFMNIYKVEQISLNEFSYLFGIPFNDVKNTYNDILRKIRKHFIKKELITKGKVYSYTNTNNCCVCESTIYDIKDRIQVGNLKLYYCSEECKNEKPVKVIKIENEFGANIDDIITTAISLFNSVSIVEKTFCISRSTTSYLFKRIGKDYNNYFTKKSQNLIKRTWHDPDWIASYFSDLENVKNKVFKKFGKPNINFNDIDLLEKNLI